MNLSERKKEILRAIIEHYVETAEPVGSKAIAADIYPPISPATARNEMAELEALGLLEQPHTSAGRVPSPLGYRVYVNELMRRHRLSQQDTLAITSALQTRVAELDRMLRQAGRLASRLMSYPAYALRAAPLALTISRFDLIHVDITTFIIVALLGGDTVRNKLIHLTVPIEQGFLQKLSTVFNAHFTGITEECITPELIASTERATGDTTGVAAAIAGFAIELLSGAEARATHFAGEMSIFEHPEFRDIEKAQRLIRYLSDDRELLRLPVPEAGGIKITIGPENLASELRDSSVVVARYDAGDGTQGLIGVVGPTRMDYGKVAARLSYIARELALLLSVGETAATLESGANEHMIGDDGIDE